MAKIYDTPQDPATLRAYQKYMAQEESQPAEKARLAQELANTVAANFNPNPPGQAPSSTVEKTLGQLKQLPTDPAIQKLAEQIGQKYTGPGLAGRVKAG